MATPKKHLLSAPPADAVEVQMKAFDPDDFTVGEIEDIEEILGSSINVIFDDDRPKGKMLKALVYITMRRSDPNFTLDDARNTKVRWLKEGTTESANPTTPTA